MATIDQMLDNVRTRLGEVSAQRPSEKQLLLHLSTQLQTFVNEANLSAKPWAVNSYPLTVSAGAEDYVIATSDFGKPIRVRTVYAANPAHIVRDIPFYELTDLNFDWNLPRNFGNLFYNADGSPNTALRIAFFRQGVEDQVYARLQPIPQLTATYDILYQVGEYGSTAALGEIPLLPQFHALIEVRTAIALLPLAEWADEPETNTVRRQQLALSLPVEEARLASHFQQYLRTITVSREISFAPAMYSVD